MIRQLTGCALIGLCLTACASKDESPWSIAYEPQRTAFADTEVVRIEPAPIDALESDPELEGHVVIGSSRFTDIRQQEQPSDPEGALAAHARDLGADLVRVGIRPAGTETRTRYISTSTPGTEPPGGNIASGRAPATQREQIPIDVEVEVFDHLAVFYRKSDS